MPFHTFGSRYAIPTDNDDVKPGSTCVTGVLPANYVIYAIAFQSQQADAYPHCVNLYTLLNWESNCLV